LIGVNPLKEGLKHCTPLLAPALRAQTEAMVSFFKIFNTVPLTIASRTGDSDGDREIPSGAHRLSDLADLSRVRGIDPEHRDRIGARLHHTLVRQQMRSPNCKLTLTA
jgi:hypothetical protein